MQLLVPALALLKLRFQLGLVVSTHLLELLKLGLRLVRPAGDTHELNQRKTHQFSDSVASLVLFVVECV